MTRPSPRDIVEGCIHRHLMSPDHKAVAEAAQEILRAVSLHMGYTHVHPYYTDPQDVQRAEGWDNATRYLWEAADE